MLNFFVNVAISVWAFAGWYFSGLGFSLVLLPRSRKAEAFLLAPLVGLCLLSIIGLFQLTFLLIPFYPRFNMFILVALSLLMCLWRSPDFISAWNTFRSKKIILFIVPFILILVFAWLFHKSGFELLVGGSDQLQYAENARHMVEEMHTGSIRDKPVARLDYYVYEMNTRIMPYIKGYRRGAEVLLGSTAKMTGLSYEDAFPVIILNSLLTLGLVLGFLGCVFFRLSLTSCLVLQTTFLSAFYLFLSQIQGSLALMLSIAPLLTGLALLIRVVRVSSWHWWLLAAIIITGYLSIYVETALITILLPSVLLILCEVWRSKLKAISSILRVFLIYVFVYVCVPSAWYSSFLNTKDNLLVAYNQHIAMLSQLISNDATNVASHYLMMQQWNLVSLILGIYSYYDMTIFNAHITQMIQSIPKMEWLLLYLVCTCALLGYFKIWNRLSYLFSFLLFLWVVIGTIFVYQMDTLRYMRALQYSMPFIILGLVILACGNHQKNSQSRFWLIATWSGRCLLAIFVCINMYTDIRTIYFITVHSLYDDPILLRFSERENAWRKLHDELNISAVHASPILFSGFHETIRPLAISIIIRDQPHMLGESISSFWRIYNDFQIRLSTKTLCFKTFYDVIDPIRLNYKFSSYKDKICNTQQDILSTILLGVMPSFEFPDDFLEITKMPVKLAVSQSEQIVDKKTRSFLTSNYFSFVGPKHISSNSAVQTDFIERLKINKSYEEEPYRDGTAYNTRISPQVLNLAKEKEHQVWSKIEPRLLEVSEQAVVPVKGGYPEEWQSTKDIYSPLIKRFTNICDVVYRKEYTIKLTDKMTSPLYRDSSGPFRILLTKGPVIIHDMPTSPQRLVINYEGKIHDVNLKIGNKYYQGQVVEKNKVRIEVSIKPEDARKLSLEIVHPVKLRALSLTPVISDV